MLERFNLPVVPLALAHGTTWCRVTESRDLFGENPDEEVYYESDSQFIGPNGSPLTTITGEDDISRAPSPFLKRGAKDTLTALRTLA